MRQLFVKKIPPWTRVALLVLVLLLIALPAAAEGNKPVSVIRKDVTLAPGETYNADLAVIAGNLEMKPDSQINGNVVVAGGNALLAGRINGNVVVVGGIVTLADSAIINGDIITPGVIERVAGATVNGQVVTGLIASTDTRLTNYVLALSSFQLDRTLLSLARYFALFMALVVTVILSALVATMWPERLAAISSIVRGSWLRCLGAGLITLLAALLLSPILIVIIIGVPLVIVLVLAVYISTLAGWAAVGGMLGARLTNKTRAASMQILVGAGLLALVAIVPVVGILVVIVIASIGTGAVVLTRFGSVQTAPLVSPASNH